MKSNLSLFTILILSVLFHSFSIFNHCFAQSPPSPFQTPKPIVRPSVKDLSVDIPYVSIDLYYSISLPEPTYSNNWIFQEGIVGISVANAVIAGGKQNFKEFNQINNNVLLSKIKGKITDEKYYEADNIYSSITSFAFDDGKLGIRKYALSDGRLYVMFVQFDNSAYSEFFENVFKTFKIVSEEDIKAEIQRKVEEATTQDLPQEPIVKNQQSDVKDENLKGKVRKIVEESETITDDVDKRNRKNSQISDYNKAGNLTKVVRIDYRGNPDSIQVYGYINGKRVSKTGYVKYPYNPPAPMPIPSRIQPEPKRDLRYTTSYENKYRNGKLIENIFYGNNGNVWYRRILNYKDNQLESLSYSSDGKLNQKIVSTLDKNGLVVEQTTYDLETDKPLADRKYSYTYEFDKQGNWIKKITSNEVTEDGKTFYKPLYIYYRTITYY